MSIEDVQEQIKRENGDLSNRSIKITEIKTEEQVNQLIQLLSHENLQIGQLTIEIDEAVADSFILQFKNKSLNPKIKELSLPGIKLSHESWEVFFEVLPGIKNLEHLHLENSNFDYSNDLSFLGGYLARNPALQEINLCNNNKKIGDTTFQTGDNAKKLLQYLENNTNLVTITYGQQFNGVCCSALSKAILQKLDSNYSKNKNEQKITQAVANLQDDTFLQNIRKKSEKLIYQSITDFLQLQQSIRDDSKIIVDNNGRSLSFILLDNELAKLHENFTLAQQNEDFSKSEQINKAASIEKYYYSQLYLLDALDKMYQQELQASPDDQPILQKLREDLLTKWQTVAKLKNIPKSNMEKFINHLINKCELSAGSVKDKTSSAVIKNVLLMLSAVLTAGLALGVYAFFTQEARAKRGSFFFKDNELSKERIMEVKQNLEDIRSEINNVL